MRKYLLFWVLFFNLHLLNAQNAPVAANDTFTINKNNQTALPVTGNDFDVDGDPITVTGVTAFSHGTASIVANKVVYLPNLNYVGTDEAVYTLCDTTLRCDSAVVFINITGLNNRPVANDDTFTINKNNQTALPVTSNDFDPDGDPITVTTVTTFAHGTAQIVANKVVYLPALNYVGTDEALYFLCDTTAQCDTGVVFINITGINNRPQALNDTFTIPENVATFLPVTGNDFDPDGDPLSITILMGAQHGTTVVTNGTQVIYTPAPFYFGPDSFSYIVCDTVGVCDTAVVYITVSGSNSPPVAVDDTYSFTDTLNATELNLTVNDFDNNNDSFFVVSIIDIDTNNTLGSATVTPDGEVVFARTPLACGTETFAYVVCQNAGGCDTGEFTITVTCPDKVFLPQGLSPDGDGLNDRLVFTGLEYFAPASLKVFNRYGALVYDNPEYQNDWDGVNMDNNKALPDGTYFYVLELVDGNKYNKYLVINR